MSRALQILHELGSRQHGVLSLAQAKGEGVAPSAVRYLVRAGALTRLHPAVFALAGTAENWHHRLMAALLICGPGALASHRAAARLWGLAGAEQDVVEILVRPGQRRKELPVIIHETDEESLADFRQVANVPVTPVERTLLDYCGVVKPELAQMALHDALNRGRTSLERLARSLERFGRRGRPGTARLRTLLDDRVGLGATLESPLEVRFLQLVRSGGLPEPVPQFEIRDDRGVFVARVDFAYPDRRLAIELDGFTHHGERDPWERDLARQNDIFGARWRLRRYTSTDIDKRPQQTLANLLQAHADAT